MKKNFKETLQIILAIYVIFHGTFLNSGRSHQSLRKRKKLVFTLSSLEIMAERSKTYNCGDYMFIQ